MHLAVLGHELDLLKGLLGFQGEFAKARNLKLGFSARVC